MKQALIANLQGGQKVMKGVNTIWHIVLSLFIIFLLSIPVHGADVYVDHDASGNNDGTAWDDAYNYLQDALDNAVSGDDIHVAQGTYYPDEDQDADHSNNVRTETFQMLSNVDMYGGYEPTGSGPRTRNVSIYVTILSGDLDQTGDKSTNDAYHVVTGANSAIIDGFTISMGYANVSGNFYGAGMYNNGVAPTITDCIFSNNTASIDGGGMYNNGADPTVTTCTFTNNTAFRGGGMGNNGASPTITGCTFSGNQTTSSGNGGGMYNYGSTGSTISGCTFSNNTASGHGGGIYQQSLDASTMSVTDCIFSNNTATNDGGGIYHGWNDTILRCSFSDNSGRDGGAVMSVGISPTFTNCVFQNNTSTSSGGGIYAYNSSLVVFNCTFSGNTSVSGGDGFMQYGSSPSITNSILWGSDNQIGTGGAGSITVTYSDVQKLSGVYSGTGNINSDPLFMSGSDYHLQDTSPCICSGTSTGAPTDDRDGNTRPNPSTSKPDMGAYEEQLIYSDYENVTTPGTYNFNESGEGGDGRDVDINFTSLTGSDDVNVREKLVVPSDAPGADVSNFYWAITEGNSISSFTANLTFHYTDPDVFGYTETEAYIGIAKFNTSTNTWIWLGGTVDSGGNTVTVNGVTSFSTFALYRRIFGDCTNDGYVDAADLQRLGNCWHDTNTGEFTGGTDARFFNTNKNTEAGDQIIDAADLQVFGNCWHNGTEP